MIVLKKKYEKITKVISDTSKMQNNEVTLEEFHFTINDEKMKISLNSDPKTGIVSLLYKENSLNLIKKAITGKSIMYAYDPIKKALNCVGNLSG